MNEREYEETTLSEPIQGNTESLSTQPPNLPAISPKAGWKTSQGQMTGVFVLVCMVLAYFGIDKKPEDLENIYEMALQAVAVLGPLIAALWQLLGYTNSRGKIQSNAINATAVLNSGSVAGIGSILGGSKWKALGTAATAVGGLLAKPDDTAEIVKVLDDHESRLRKLGA